MRFMPPRKGIIKSGNAGNSSKSVAKATENAPSASNTEPPLFPSGSKYPLSILNERCQKLGWEKPIVDTRNHPKDGWSFSVTLAKINKKTSARETVQLSPHPPYYRSTALEARHWGATYALYRFCNGIQLNLVLPPGPRDYWNELAIEHKAAPEHQNWMYDPDPFGAHQLVHERQAKAAQKNEGPAQTTKSRNTSGFSQFSQSAEIKMASSLRDLVEDAVKKGNALFPRIIDEPALRLNPDGGAKIRHQLLHLGFNENQIKNTLDFLSGPSSFASTLLRSLQPLEAAIEYLVLHVPECDLPQRFLPDNNSSNPFITTAYAGEDSLKRRWIEEKAIKEGGWPAHAVRSCTADPKCAEHWEALLVALGNMLIGEDDNINMPATPYSIDRDEYEALGARLEEADHFVMPLWSVPIQVHIFTSPNEKFPRPGYIPLYLSSTTIPAYIRLHLLSNLLKKMKSNSQLESGEGFFTTIITTIEEAWAVIADNGPPNMSNVLRHLVPQLDETPEPDMPSAMRRRTTQRERIFHSDTRSSAQIKEEFQSIRRNEKFTEILAMRQKLPAYRVEEQFLAYMDRNRAIVVVGETGCGKTTQLPQFILDSLIESNRGSNASIIITQPRRISAISVANRVSYERLDDASVGYAIRGESKFTNRTKLLFCTTGVVLRRLSSGDDLRNVSHVVVDEVHERSMDGDFLLLELRELLKRHPTLKVILMSATINHETFVKYFDGAPLMEIPGFTHPVKDVYLEDILQLVPYRPSPTKTKVNKNEKPSTFRSLHDEYEHHGFDTSTINALDTLSRSDQIDYELISAVVKHVVSSNVTRGGILIFLPGVNEIRQCSDSLRKVLRQSEVEILPLHANLSSDEQRIPFKKTHKWKVVVATNIAETSITIDDVIYVIDAGKVKETQYDSDLRLTRLVESRITRAAARQRRGRAGRTQPGVCYKLYTRSQERNMAPFPIPEILRVPLESISLSVKAMREEQDVKKFLSRAIDPPTVIAMDTAWKALEELGAIDQEGALTALGKHISMLPIDIRLAKMLILGSIFQCLGPILTITACLSSKPLFVSPMDKRDEASKARVHFSQGRSDLLTDINAFDAFLKVRLEQGSSSALRSFCEENFISISTMREILTLRQEFINALVETGYIPSKSTPSSPEINQHSGNLNLLKAIVLGGLWPRVARVHLPHSAIKFDKVQAGTIQRQISAKDFKIYDIAEGRVFLHPSSVLFGESAWKSPFLVYFHKHMTTKVFLRDATEVPLYALLLLGGPVNVNHIAGGLTIGTGDHIIKLRAEPRIGILGNQLRRLLDQQLQSCFEDGKLPDVGSSNPVIKAMLALLTNDGLS